MPKEGYVSITVSDELYEKLQKLAESDGITIQKEIGKLLEKIPDAADKPKTPREKQAEEAYAKLGGE